MEIYTHANETRGIIPYISQTLFKGTLLSSKKEYSIDSFDLLAETRLRALRERFILCNVRPTHESYAMQSKVRTIVGVYIISWIK